MKKNTLFIILIISIALLIGIWRDHQESSSAQSVKEFSLAPLVAGTALGQAQKLPEFELTDMNDKPFNNARLNEHWTFLFFGYSYCPSICPTTLAAMHQISQRLHAGSQVQFVFVTIDPERDTPTRLKEYLKQAAFKGTHFLGVTGIKDQIQNLAFMIGIHISQENDKAAAHIEHSGALLLINPDGKLAAIFTSSEKPHAIAHDFKEIVHRYTNTR